MRLVRRLPVEIIAFAHPWRATAGWIALGALLEGAGLALLVPLLALLGRERRGRWRQSADHVFTALALDSPLARVAIVLAISAMVMTMRAIVLTRRDRAVAALQHGFVAEARGRMAALLTAARWQDVVRLRHARIIHVMTTELDRVSVAVAVMLRGTVAATMSVLRPR